MPSRRHLATRTTVHDVSEIKGLGDLQDRLEEPPAKEPRRAHTWNGDLQLPGVQDAPASPRSASQLNALLQAVSLAHQAHEVPATKQQFETRENLAPPSDSTPSTWDRAAAAEMLPSQPSVTSTTLRTDALIAHQTGSLIEHAVSSEDLHENRVDMCESDPTPLRTAASNSDDKSSDDEKSERSTDAEQPRESAEVAMKCDDAMDGVAQEIDCERSDARPELHRPCAACRTAKVKCSRELPCTRCRRLSLFCTPPPTVQRGRPSHHARFVQLCTAAPAPSAPPPYDLHVDPRMPRPALRPPAVFVPPGIVPTPTVGHGVRLHDVEAAYARRAELVCPQFACGGAMQMSLRFHELPPPDGQLRAHPTAAAPEMAAAAPPALSLSQRVAMHLASPIPWRPSYPPGHASISSRIEHSLKENSPLPGEEILTEVQQMERQFGQARVSQDALRAQLLQLGVKPCA
ncbi:hypothetical protein AB1Y20_005271 [Prymnesium parvum]|uniref:Zn(2)-C6 fungal-type domain-containing protein n=1 Tax=Prymnesium parvum TaxID=97485 RepID=A0AB34J448_PRYPA